MPRPSPTLAIRARQAVLRALAALLGLAGPLQAQAPQPFSRVGLSVSGSFNLNRERLHDFWSPGGGAMVRLETPFHWGVAAVGAQRTPFSPREPGLPALAATALTVEWGVERRLAGPIHGSAGVQVGNMRFGFTDAETGEDRDSESELLLGAGAGVSARVAGALGVGVAATRQRVLTHHPIHLTFLTVGLSYSLDAPQWFRDFLR